MREKPVLAKKDEPRKPAEIKEKASWEKPSLSCLELGAETNGGAMASTAENTTYNPASDVWSSS